eukprot:6188384-Pleurochrysis_carterae.AAC.1
MPTYRLSAIKPNVSAVVSYCVTIRNFHVFPIGESVRYLHLRLSRCYWVLDSDARGSATARPYVRVSVRIQYVRVYSEISQQNNETCNAAVQRAR